MRYLLLIPIKLYQLLLSPLLGNHCRFLPTCSQYAYTAIKQYGLLKGLGLSLARISKCHPWGHNGFDPVPEKATSINAHKPNG